MTSETASLFKDKYYLYKKGRLQYKNNKYFPAAIEIDEAVKTILAAAKENDPAMYREFQQLAGPFRRFSMCMWQNACVNTVRHAMV